MSEYYILDNEKNVVSTNDMKEWGQMFNNTDKRRVARTELKDNVEVSTVFLGLDHQWGDGPPLLFGTMTFGSEWDECQWRYSTWDEAVKGHNEIVSKIKAGLTPQEVDQD